MAYAQWPGTPGYEYIGSFGYRGRPILGVVPVEEKYPWGSNTSSKIAAFWDANPNSPHPHPETVPSMDHPWVQ